MEYLILFMLAVGFTTAAILQVCRNTSIFSAVAAMCISVYVFICLILFMFMVGDYVENHPKQIDRGDVTYGNHGQDRS